MVTVDTQKKELIGNFKNPGAEGEPEGSPELVNVSDFKDEELGKGIPYGVYDQTTNRGWVMSASILIRPTSPPRRYVVGG